MISTVTVSFSKASRPLAIGVFIISWWVGTASLIGGLEGMGEFWPLCTFAAACALWFWAYKLRDSKTGPRSSGGFLVIALWMIHLLGAALLGFHHYITDRFFLVSVGLVLLLLVGVALSAPRAASDPQEPHL
jgi:hypothetical protein